MDGGELAEKKNLAQSVYLEAKLISSSPKTSNITLGMPVSRRK
jgi:hypothetical protein